MLRATVPGRMSESGEISPNDRTPFWQWPSCLCLVAPLVAVAWSLFLGGRLDGSTPPLLSPLPHLGLGLAVWAIYLFDRLYDTRASVSPPRTTVRHRFARRHRRGMATLFGLAMAGGLALVPFLASSRGLLVATSLLGIGVVGYYSVFRFFPMWRRWALRIPAIPWKEATVATSFTVGIALAAGLSPGRPEVGHALAAFWFLVLGNCLFIAREEEMEDRQRDPAAFFARCADREIPRMSSVALVAPPLLVLVSSPLAPWFGANPAVSAALALSAGLLLSLMGFARSGMADSGAPQVLADMALFLPPVIALGVFA